MELINEFNLQEALVNDIAGQQRTGKHKQLVFFRGDFVYKGPYQPGRLDNAINRSQIFRQWNTPCVFPLVGYTPDRSWAKFPNIMRQYQLQYVMHQETFPGGFNVPYKILQNPPVVDIGHHLAQYPWIVDEAADLILGLCHCNILSVGDTNLRNAMVDPMTRQLYIIDIDDNLVNETKSHQLNEAKLHLGTDFDDEVFYFSRKPAKDARWYERVAVHYPVVADRLAVLLTDPIVIAQNLRHRVEHAIALLRRYAVPGTVPIVARKDLNTLTNGLAALTITPAARTLTLNVVPPKVVDPVIPPQNIDKPPTPGKLIGPAGQMVWKGLMAPTSRTFSGIELDLAKSALQKYVRRGFSQKAILAALELYRMGEAGGDAAVSNMYNRLAIISSEDVSLTNLPIILEVMRIVETKDRDVHRLIAMVQLLCESSHTRMASHVWSTYATTDGRAYATKLGVPLDTDFTESDLAYIKEHWNDDIFLPNDPDNLRPLILIFLKRLQDQDFNAFSWVYFFLARSKDANGKDLTIGKRKKFIKEMREAPQEM